MHLRCWILSQHHVSVFCLSLLRFSTEEEAVAIANMTSSGLAGQCKSYFVVACCYWSGMAVSISQMSDLWLQGLGFDSRAPFHFTLQLWACCSHTSFIAKEYTLIQAKWWWSVQLGGWCHQWLHILMSGFSGWGRKITCDRVERAMAIVGYLLTRTAEPFLCA